MLDCEGWNEPLLECCAVSCYLFPCYVPSRFYLPSYIPLLSERHHHHFPPPPCTYLILICFFMRHGIEDREKPLHRQETGWLREPQLRCCFERFGRLKLGMTLLCCLRCGLIVQRYHQYNILLLSQHLQAVALKEASCFFVNVSPTKKSDCQLFITRPRGVYGGISVEL